MVRKPTAGAGQHGAGRGSLPPAASSSESVVVASFSSRRAAERMVASLGHRFRHQALKGGATAYVVTRDHDGSFKVAQSRSATATGVVSNVGKFAAIVVAGLYGIGPAIKGVKAAGHRAHQRQSGVGQNANRLAELFDELGPNGACVLFSCVDDETAATAAKRADERGSHSSHYSQRDFLAVLEHLGHEYDWLRPTVSELDSKATKKQKSHRKRRHPT